MRFTFTAVGLCRFMEVNAKWESACTNNFYLIVVNVWVPKSSTFAIKLCKAPKHAVSPLSISTSWTNRTCQMTLKCHNHWDVFFPLRRPGRADDGHVIMSLSSRWPWLAHARPDYRGQCWWRVTLRRPAACYQEPRKLGHIRLCPDPLLPQHWFQCMH